MKEYNFKINGNEYKVTIDTVEGGKAAVNVNGTDYNVEIGEQLTPKMKKPVQVAPATYQATPTIATPSQPVSAPAAGGAGSIKIEAGAAGKVFKIDAAVGTAVKKGDAVITIEAMKMEIPVVAPAAGTIASIDVTVGETVESGAVLATLN